MTEISLPVWYDLSHIREVKRCVMHEIKVCSIGMGKWRVGRGILYETVQRVSIFTCIIIYHKCVNLISFRICMIICISLFYLSCWWYLSKWLWHIVKHKSIYVLFLTKLHTFLASPVRVNLTYLLSTYVMYVLPGITRLLALLQYVCMQRSIVFRLKEKLQTKRTNLLLDDITALLKHYMTLFKLYNGY